MPLKLHLTLTRDLLWISVFIFLTKSKSLLEVTKVPTVNYSLHETCDYNWWRVLVLGGLFYQNLIYVELEVRCRSGLELHQFSVCLISCVCVCVGVWEGGRWLKSHPALSTESVDIGVDITSVPIKFSYMIEVNWASMTRHLCSCYTQSVHVSHIYRWSRI